VGRTVPHWIGALARAVRRDDCDGGRCAVGLWTAGQLDVSSPHAPRSHLSLHVRPSHARLHAHGTKALERGTRRKQVQHQASRRRQSSTQRLPTGSRHAMRQLVRAQPSGLIRLRRLEELDHVGERRDRHYRHLEGLLELLHSR